MPRWVDLVDLTQPWGLDLEKVQTRFESFDPTNLASASELSKDIQNFRIHKARLNEIMVELGKLYRAQETTQIELTALDDRIKLTWVKVNKLYEKERTKHDKSGIVKELLGQKLGEDQDQSTTHLESENLKDSEVKIDEETLKKKWKECRAGWKVQRTTFNTSLDEIKKKITTYLFNKGPNDPIHVLGRIQELEERILGILGCHKLTLAHLRILPLKRKLTSLPISASAPIDIAANLDGVPKLFELIDLKQPWGLNLDKVEEREDTFRRLDLISKDPVSSSIINIRHQKAHISVQMDELAYLYTNRQKLQKQLDSSEESKKVRADVQSSIDSISARIIEIMKQSTGRSSLCVAQSALVDVEHIVLGILGFYGLTGEHLDKLPAKEKKLISHEDAESLSEPVQEEKKTDGNSGSTKSSPETAGEDISDEEKIGDDQHRQRSLSDSQTLKEEGENPQVKVHLRRSSSLPSIMPQESEEKTGSISKEPIATERSVFVDAEAPISFETEDDLASSEVEEAPAPAPVTLARITVEKINLALGQIQKKIKKDKKVTREEAIREICLISRLPAASVEAILQNYMSDHPGLKFYESDSKEKKSKK